MSDHKKHEPWKAFDAERVARLHLPAWAMRATARRSLLRDAMLGMGSVVACLACVSQPVQAQSARTQALRARRWPSGALKVEFPPLADSGLAVPYSVEVTSPAGLRLRSLEVLLPENPSPLALRVTLSKPQVHYRLSTRLRLSASQEAWAVATFDDGSQQAVGASTVVTASACLDES